MSFVLKKAKPVRVMLGDTIADWEERKAEAEELRAEAKKLGKEFVEFTEPEPDESKNMVLLVKQIKVEKLMNILAKHQETFADITERAEEAKAKGKKNLYFTSDNVEMMQDVKEAVLEATSGWDNVVDEAGNPVPYSAELLAEEVEHNLSMYTQLMRALTAATARPVESAAKN